jgi:hypothetical protein
LIFGDLKVVDMENEFPAIDIILEIFKNFMLPTFSSYFLNKLPIRFFNV